MYLWNVQALKADLTDPGLTARQELAYLVPILCVLAATFVTVPQHNIWSVVYGGLVILIIVLGSAHAYHCNGGADGVEFVSRFLPLAWVCGVRWITFLVLPITVTMVIVPGSPWKLVWPGEQPPLGLFDVAVRLVLVPPLFWIIGRHLHDLAARPSRGRARGEAPAEDDLGFEPLED